MSQADNKNVALTAALPQKKLLVDGDGEKIGIAISHLVKNAITFTDEGGSVQVIGDPAETISHNFSNSTDGTVDFDGRVLTYTGLEPIIDDLSALARVFACAPPAWL